MALTNILIFPRVRNKVFSHLSWSDLLGLRATCNALNTIVKSYTTEHHEIVPEIVITSDAGRDLLGFLRLGISTDKIYLKNIEGHMYFERNMESLNTLINRIGKNTKQLRVYKLSAFLCGAEYLFLERLTSLTHLFVDNLTYEIRDADDMNRLLDLATDDNPMALPIVFSHLETLEINQDGDIGNSPAFLYNLSCLRYAQKLKKIKLPYSDSKVNVPLESTWLRNSHGVLHAHFMTLCVVLNIPQINWDMIDFYNIHQSHIDNINKVEVLASHFFLELCNTALEKGTKLKCVSPNWFIFWHDRHLFNDPRLRMSELGQVVLSITNLTPAIFGLELPNLETIDILATSKCNVSMYAGQQRPAWPKLTNLKMYVDSKVFVETSDIYLPARNGGICKRSNFTLDTEDTYNFLFRNIQHTNLETLELCFKANEGGNQVSIPNTVDIVNACPNVKNIKLVNWPGTNQDLSILWGGLTQLNDVSIEATCRSKIGNVGFIGQYHTYFEPIFLNLKDLRRLSLKGLEYMPDITNTLFSQVVCKMKLSHLHIMSATPLESITLDGIKSLLNNGPFATTITRFSFKSWSLKNVSMSDMKECEKMFRSYYI